LPFQIGIRNVEMEELDQWSDFRDAASPKLLILYRGNIQISNLL
jgi:hypothetical protein